MKSVSVTQEKNFEITSVPVPNLLPNQIRVKIYASGVTDNEIKIKNGFYKVPLPIAAGTDISGVIEQIGSHVSEEFKVGEEVSGIIPADIGGGLAEYISIEPYYFVKKPPVLSHEQSVALLSSGLHALMALHYKLKITQGDTILIANAASSYGVTAIQIAQFYGAKIIAVVRDSQEAAFLRSTPCKVARLIDLSVEHLVPKIMEETANLGVDGIIENGRGGESSSLKSDLIKCLAINGHYLTSTAIQLDPPETEKLLLKNNSISFFNAHSLVMGGSQQGRVLHMINEVFNMAAHQSIQGPVLISFNLDRIGEAVKHFEENGTKAVVVTINK
eukprot:TRINITY_DN2506_c0_g1_i1.p1 TRINITY_DN2506_c0_g1~~TRINITY_DN2506_c0_g1_i1.p1  ORF type:complete len:331 (+),score=15.79 TRINITY_DN2506_c0_g1_i1:75-1067(+)